MTFQPTDKLLVASGATVRPGRVGTRVAKTDDREIVVELWIGGRPSTSITTLSIAAAQQAIADLTAAVKNARAIAQEGGAF